MPVGTWYRRGRFGLILRCRTRKSVKSARRIPVRLPVPSSLAEERPLRESPQREWLEPATDVEFRQRTSLKRRNLGIPLQAHLRVYLAGVRVCGCVRCRFLNSFTRLPGLIMPG